ncbi:MAG: hypothetical protein ACKO3W_15445 [bacterium]
MPIMRDFGLRSILASIDPALEGKELGPWMMVPAVVSVPLAATLAAVLIWYFVRLGRGDVAPLLRRIRRLGIAFALASLVPFVRALTFVHPHEDRAGWATAWAVAFLALLGWFLLAVVDVVIVLRGGARDYRELRREVFGRPKENGANDGAG